MKPVAIDTDAFLQARLIPTYHFSDGAQNDLAIWWRRTRPVAGATWHLEPLNFGEGPGGPAVVDDFGTLVLAEVRS